MKKANFIISHLKQHPSYEKLEQLEAYKKLFALLPNRLGDVIRFAYNKNQTLFIVLNHPGYKMEFNYKTTLIKSLLKELIKRDFRCKCIDADEIKVFVSNKAPLTTKTKSAAVPFYEERSSGNFKNFSKDSKLNRLFEEIRGIICSKIS
ncbi:MAG: hypothetical protein LBG67_01270 [Campylobacteraceae bacterium]|jgi:hypothetical protein|nr:hypothetical protein [Campylobacteraceae bacterium]